MNKIDKSYEEIKNNYNHFGRERFFDSLMDYIAKINGSYSIALDGNWGSGKTIFVKKMIDELKTLKDRSGNDVCSCLYLNSWMYDYFESPIYALLNHLLDNEEFYQIFQTSLSEDDKKALSYSFHIGFASVEVKSGNIIEKELSTAKYGNFVMDLINRVIDKYMLNHNKLVLFIDELDRCKPDYAIRLLEQINHISNDKIVIVFSVNLYQLKGVANSYYGNNLEDSYFHKFFDEIIALPRIDSQNITSYLINQVRAVNEWDYNDSILLDLMKSLDITFRDLNRYIVYLKRIRMNMHDSNRIKSKSVFMTCLLILCIIKVKTPFNLYNIIKNIEGGVSFEQYLVNYDRINDYVMKEHTEKRLNHMNIDSVLIEMLMNIDVLRVLD